MHRGIHVLVVVLFLGVVPSFNCFAAKKSEKSCNNLLGGSSAIPKRWVKKMQAKSVHLEPALRRLHDIVQRSGFYSVALNQAILKSHNTEFTHELWQGPSTDQSQSGRCWIFAGLNMLRSELMAQNKVPQDFQFSENYLHFFSMLEKSNRYLERIISDGIESAKDDKLSISKLEIENSLTPDIGDGGWFQWFQFLVEKYGLVPNSAMPDSVSAANTKALLEDITDHLATTAAHVLGEVQAVKEKGRSPSDPKIKRQLRKIKAVGMEGLWKILAAHLGTPPSRFEFRISGEKKVKKGVFITSSEKKTFSPLQFARTFAMYDPKEYIVVTAFPQHENGQVYEFEDSGIGHASPGNNSYNIRYLNVSSDRLLDLTLHALEGGQAVWFAADISQDIDHNSGIMHPDIYDRQAIYGLSKSEKLPGLNRDLQFIFGTREPNHAMVFTGFDRPDPNRPVVKLKVENSWGTEAGLNGNYSLYRQWWPNVYEIVVHKRFLTAAELDLWNNSTSDGE